MKTIIINGSPKGNASNCNSRIYAEAFVRNMKDPCEIRAIARADLDELARYVSGFDAVIFVLPLYIHAMPGVMMRFIETLDPEAMKGKRLGFIVQAGFMETAQSRFLAAYLADLARQLGCTYLGLVAKGEAAATYMMPNMFKKVFQMLNDLGRAYEETQAFDPGIVARLGQPRELSRRTLFLLKVVDRIGLDKFFWNREMKKNGTYEQRLAQPFL